ncbi:murein biosynthesis integral membrane protein MurJ [Virgibacillus sp. MSP4-1]|uniref:murein biosynthesis integral membrane protein MurJ n=1 Tax=Virgibacillus sp. MSP4-1 TaxID=2700081 RepID=UPI0003A4A35F|nr:murein biosynthesis integral membrane protein MurJ [Virgibacillus sp. MSP4-1]QHS23511.1 murein biosynthesis integral membrane protein MurJ [Virgibacillus sp. MSP4-1]
MKSKIGFASLLFMFATLLLKVSALIRDMVIAYFFGGSYVADAYLAAFILPNMIILFLMTGMKNAFVPSYIQALEYKKESHHLNQVFKGTIFFSFILSLVGIISARSYIPALFPEFNPATQEIAIYVSIILFASITFVGMNAVLSAYFDAIHKYTYSVISQNIVVISTILGALLFADNISVYSLAFGYLAGTVLAFLYKLSLLIPKNVIQVKEKLNLKEIKSFYVVFVPVALTAAVGQINLFVDNVFASYFGEGAVTFINYAKTLVHFPQAIFGVTIGTVVFPILSKAIAENQQRLFKEGIERGLTAMFYILLPAIVGMMMLMPSIIDLLYERGAFNHNDTMTTTQVAYYYFGSVLFFSLHNIVNKGFYTLKKGHLILGIGCIAVILNVLLNFIFTNWIGYKGIPLASSVMAFCYVLASFIVLYKLTGAIPLKNIGIEFAKVIFSVLVMAAIIRGALPLTQEWSDILQIIVISISGACVYFLCTYILRSRALQFFIQTIQHRSGGERNGA